MKKYKLKPNVLMDQHFMIDEDILDKMVNLSDLKAYESVLEIGAGYGNLTKKIADKKPKMVYAIEKDKRFLPVLKDELAQYQNVQIMIGDALKIKFPQTEKIISNIPYSISEALFQKLIYQTFISAVMTFPKPFVDRITAKPTDKNYTKLSLMSSVIFDIKIDSILPPEVFYPPPKVTSVLVVLTPQNSTEFKTYLTRSLFLQRDKKIKNALREALIQYSYDVEGRKLTKRKSKEIINSTSLDYELLEKSIPTLSLEEIKKIVNTIAEKKNIIKLLKCSKFLKSIEQL
jgi:16S rRNA (adenine1518-N6/adenine1519-N6)-dimethyltransferase